MKMFLFLYNFAWTLAALIAIPVLSLSRGLRLSDRLGLRLPRNPFEKRCIWIHALSVGEVISAIPLARAIKARYPLLPLVFTVKTAQGLEVAKRELGGEADAVVPMPLDFWWSISRLYHSIRPSLLILVEGDIWPGLLHYLKKRGIKVLLVNGRISPRTMKGYRRFRAVARPVLKMIDLFMVQSEIDRERLLETGLDPETVRDTGNIKFDRTWLPMGDQERERWLGLLRLRREALVWVAGSTHDGEHEIILDTFRGLKGQVPDLYLIIAPRRIESATEVYRLGRDMGLGPVLRSELGNGSPCPPHEVLILDTIGELERVYGLAHICFVGGSMVPVGGHNLLEPASFGRPVLFGKYMHNFHLMSLALREAGGGWMVRDREDLFLKMKALLTDQELSTVMGERARGFVEKNSGAMDRIMTHLEGYIETDD